MFGPFGPFGGINPLLIPLFLFLGFVLLFVVIPALVRQARISASPVQTRRARVIAKRMQVWGHQRTRTNYYVAFELEGGGREEFATSGEQYGILVEGDEGSLTTQGPLLHDFQRNA